MSTKEVILEGGPPWGFRMHGDGAAGTPFRISRVNPGSRAAGCGLREGELVISISGVPAATLSTAQAHQLMREAGHRMELILAAREMPSPRMGRKQAPATAPAPTQAPAPAPAPAPVRRGSPSPVRRDPVSVPGAVPSVGPRRSPGRSPSPARTAVDGVCLARSGSQEGLNAAFERLATGAVSHQQSQQAQQQAQQQATPPPVRRAAPLSRSRSLDRPPGLHRTAANGETSQPGGETGSSVTSPLPPPSPKLLSRSPSLRRRGVWQPSQTSSSTSDQPEVKAKTDDGPLIKEPIWTPKSSPTLERKQYRPINYDSNSLERKKKSAPPSPPPPPPSESFAWRGPEVPERAAVPVRSSSLPRPESATVTLLREAREGHLPRGAQYLSGVDGGRHVLPRRAPPVKEVEGVGPTISGGMPVALRSTVKGENRQDWYRRVYDNLHRQPQARSSYGLGGYSSEPEINYDDELNPRCQSRQSAERYRGQPGRIEDYTPGQSSLAEQEAAKYWEEVMGYFDKFLDEHSHIRLERPLRGVRSAANQSISPPNNSYAPRTLDGYESDSTLVYHRNEPPVLTSGEQRSYYNQIQRGGDVPLSGLRKPAPERPKVAGPRYQEAAVNIHYRSPVRWEEKEPLSEDELRRRQEDNMRRVYEEARRRREERLAEDRESRRHGDNFTPSQKSPIPLDRYERLFDDVTDDRRPAVTAAVLHEFRAQNNRELSLSRGDTVRIRRKIDSNWYEGQKGSRIGIFPVTYVQVTDPRERSADRRSTRPQVRARHRFTAQSSMELSLNKGDVVTILRRVDDNWFEGRRGDTTGIFPASYVEPLSADNADGGPRQKPVGAPAAHGLVKDGLSLRSSSERDTLRAPSAGRDQLRVEVQQNTMPYRVLFPYRHQNEDELDLEEGDTIHVLEQCPDGWYVGTNVRTGMFGTFPGNYTRRM